MRLRPLARVDDAVPLLYFCCRRRAKEALQAPAGTLRTHIVPGAGIMAAAAASAAMGSTVTAGTLSSGKPFLTATFSAPTNIAVIKYWGKRDVKLNLPINSSGEHLAPAGTCRVRVAAASTSGLGPAAAPARSVGDAEPGRPQGNDQRHDQPRVREGPPLAERRVSSSTRTRTLRLRAQRCHYQPSLCRPIRREEDVSKSKRIQNVLAGIRALATDRVRPRAPPPAPAARVAVRPPHHIRAPRGPAPQTLADGTVVPAADIANPAVWRAHIVSANSFPTAAGLASSAAGYACLSEHGPVLRRLAAWPPLCSRQPAATLAAPAPNPPRRSPRARRGLWRRGAVPRRTHRHRPPGQRLCQPLPVRRFRALDHGGPGGWFRLHRRAGRAGQPLGELPPRGGLVPKHLPAAAATRRGCPAPLIASPFQPPHAPPPPQPELEVVVCVVSAAKKETGSTAGMTTSVETSELLA